MVHFKRWFAIILVLLLCMGCLQFKQIDAIPSNSITLIEQQSLVIDLTFKCNDGDQEACHDLLIECDKLKKMNP